MLDKALINYGLAAAVGCWCDDRPRLLCLAQMQLGLVSAALMDTLEAEEEGRVEVGITYACAASLGTAAGDGDSA